MRRALLAAALCAAAWARAELPPPVEAIVARAGIPHAAVSAVVVPLDDGPAALSHNATAPFNPASVMKVITAFAALDLLGPAFTFNTDFLVTGEIANGVLDGNLHIRGGGDPKLTYERVWQAANQLRARGLREIRGDIVIDRGYFAPAIHDPASFDNDPRRAYNVGADALLVNFNTVAFRFVPEGDRVRVVPEPDLPNVEVTSRLRTTREPCYSFRGGMKQEALANGLLVSVFFDGTYPLACGERVWPLAVLDPPRFTESVLRWAWSQAGGVLRGGVRAGPVPAEAKLFHRHESEPVAYLVRDMNKHSNNVMARHLFLALSAEANGKGAETKASAQRVRDWLKSRHIDAPELVLENGSGLSRVERASTATIAAVLKSAWRSAVQPELASSFPLFAADGTLKRRRGAAAGQAHLKGGTLNDVQSIAGYVLDRGGRRWAVAITINHAKAGAAQGALDALVEWTFEGAGRKVPG